MPRSLLTKAGAGLSSLAFAVSLFPVSSFAFSDVQASAQYGTAINALEQKGVLEGYADGTFKAGNTINRAEFLKIVLEGSGTKDVSGSNCFPDVTDQWFAKYVCAAKKMDIVAGYPDGTFKPEQNISFVEASKIMTLAYRQQVQQTGGEWYQPYATALESSKAIPPTVQKVDSLLTRGEMAEMMWRLSDQKTDQPTKGLLNLKHPELTINTASDAVQTAKTCADLSAFTSSQAEMNMGYGGGVRNQMLMEKDAAAPMAPSAGAARQASDGATADHSTTNVQVEGVDEADIVKTDGTYVYVIHNQTVHIVQASPASNMKDVATIDFSKENVGPADLYIEGDHLIVLGNSWGGPVYRPMNGAADAKMAMPYYGGGRQQIRIYDVSVASSPKLLRTISIDGNAVSSRMIGSKLYLVLNSNMYWGQPIPLKATSDILPKIQDSKNGTVDKPVTNCDRVAILPHPVSPAYLTVAVVPTNDLNKDVSTKVIVGDGQNVYSSLNNLYVAQTQWNYIWDSAKPSSTEKTNVYRFAITADGVDLKAQGSVPGHILNQFAMDENDNYFRIATTTGQSWDNQVGTMNNVYVLNMDMQTTGKLENLAPGESIYSVRFMGDRAYLVTFQQVDPLFVIDTSNPNAPKVLGKLKIPGYSNYLHPIDDTHIMGFGKDVDASIDADKVHTPGAIYYTAVKGMKIGIFDVSDVSNPKEMYNETIGDRGTDSPLLTDHHALLYDKDTGLLAFPVNVMQYSDAEKLKKPEEAVATQVFQGAYVYNVSLSKGFTLKGKITHYTQDDMAKSGNYLWGKDISRILRLGDSLVTVSQGGVQSHTLSTVQFQNKVDFPADQGNPPTIYPMQPMR